MSDRSPQERLQRKADRVFQGYPLGTVAFYGPDDQRASKVAVSVFYRDGEEVRDMEKWFSEVADIRDDESIAHQVLEFLQKHAVRTVVTGPGPI